MIGLVVTIPIACFRKGYAREFLETEAVPPPATCYGFLLSMIGEPDRTRHLGARICPIILQAESGSVVLRTVWRVKNRPLGSPGNTRPDYQQLLTNVRLVIWVDSGQEDAGDAQSLEDRLQIALTNPGHISRFGGLSLGESTHLVNDVSLVNESTVGEPTGEAFLLAKRGRLTLPVWVDHVGSSGTVYVVGDLVTRNPRNPPALDEMPQIVCR